MLIIFARVFFFCKSFKCMLINRIHNLYTEITAPRHSSQGPLCNDNLVMEKQKKLLKPGRTQKNCRALGTWPSASLGGPVRIKYWFQTTNLKLILPRIHISFRHSSFHPLINFLNHPSIHPSIHGYPEMQIRSMNLSWWPPKHVTFKRKYASSRRFTLFIGSTPSSLKRDRGMQRIKSNE